MFQSSSTPRPQHNLQDETKKIPAALRQDARLAPFFSGSSQPINHVSPIGLGADSTRAEIRLRELITNHPSLCSWGQTENNSHDMFPYVFFMFHSTEETCFNVHL